MTLGYLLPRSSTRLNPVHRQRSSAALLSQAAQSRCPVLTATFKVNGRWQISTPYRMETLSPIANKNDTRDYVREATSCAKFGANPPAGVFWGDG